MRGALRVATYERQARGQRAAGQHLRMLLLRFGQYRDEWERYARDVRPDDIRQEAICRVIAEYLYETGERDEQDTGLARALKDRVSRALSGGGVSLQTLRWFEEAFGLSPHDSQRLRELYRGDSRRSVIVGNLPAPADAAKRQHETTLLFEHHVIGRDGIPARHHTQQTIRSLVDGMQSYQYRFDTPHVEVRVMRGGRAGPVYQLAEPLWAVDIEFRHPLRYDEVAYLDYWALFRYESQPAPEFRRGAHVLVQHLDMRVEFHRQKLPQRLWWAEWEDYRDPNEAVAEQEDLTLDEEYSAHRYLESIEHAVVGFRWSW